MSDAVALTELKTAKKPPPCIGSEKSTLTSETESSGRVKAPLKNCALDITVEDAKSPRLSIATSTAAPFASTRDMLQPTAIFNLSIPITPLCWKAFKSMLDACELSRSFPDLVQFIRYGFPIGPMATITQTIIQHNHARDPKSLSIIRKNFMDEVKEGRMLGPLSVSEAQSLLKGHFRTSPVGLVPKADSPGKFRVIRDLSFAGNAGRSINDEIPSDRPTCCVPWDEFTQLVSHISPLLSQCYIRSAVMSILLLYPFCHFIRSSVISVRCSLRTAVNLFCRSIHLPYIRRIPWF